MKTEGEEGRRNERWYGAVESGILTAEEEIST